MDRSRSEWTIVIPALLWGIGFVSCDVAKGDVSIPAGYPVQNKYKPPPRPGWWMPKIPGKTSPRWPIPIRSYCCEIRRSCASHDVPFPFSSLVQLIGDRIDPENGVSRAKRVLMPLNRSLQRHAPKPDFFKYPRAVLAVDTEPAFSPESAGMLLKDRLYVGYQEKANTLEVISYNEAAGRFEFQVVKDYRAEAHGKCFTRIAPCARPVIKIMGRYLRDNCGMKQMRIQRSPRCCRRNNVIFMISLSTRALISHTRSMPLRTAPINSLHFSCSGAKVVKVFTTWSPLIAAPPSFASLDTC